jgi:ribosomal protein S12 methylthiotransferase
VRLHYVYPYPHVDWVLPLMAEGKILPYLDIPFQHASPRVLKAMRRPAHQERTLERLARWRAACPDLAVRSTFIVGFPGETEEDFALLLDWLKTARLARVGCFKYEAVEGAAANALPGAVPEEVKEERWHRFMAAQRQVSREVMAAGVGRSIDVIVDEVDEGGATGRSKWDAPEIDGSVRLEGQTGVKPGHIVRARVTRADEYDVWAEVAGEGHDGTPANAAPR